MCSCHLFLISSASARSLLFVSFIMSIYVWNVSLISTIFLKRSRLSHSIVFFALFIQEGILIYPCYSLKLCIQLGVSFPFLQCFRLLSSAICKGAISLPAGGGNGKPLQEPHEHKQYEKHKYLSTNLTNIYKICMRKTIKLMSESKGPKKNWPLSNAGASPCITYSWSSVSTVAPHSQIQANMDCV